MPHPARKRWIKLWTQESLYGSISKELEPPERWAWIGLLLLAGDSMENGVVCAAPGVPWTDEQIAKILALPLETWQSAKAKMLGHKIEENHNGLRIMNWDKYQGFDKGVYQKEYMRGVRQNVRQDVRQNVSLQEEEGRGGEYSKYLRNTNKRRRGVVKGATAASKIITLSGEEQEIIAILLRLKAPWGDDIPAKLQEVMADFPGQLTPLEAKNFVEWWADKKAKRPWLALRKWLGKVNVPEVSGFVPGSEDYNPRGGL